MLSTFLRKKFYGNEHNFRYGIGLRIFIASLAAALARPARLESEGSVQAAADVCEARDK